MKRDKWLNCLIAVILSWCIGCSGILCLQSAFGLTANVSYVILGCAISAVMFSVGFTVKWWYVPLLLVAPATGYLWYRGSLSGSVQWVLYQISTCYDQAYGTGFLYGGQISAIGDGTMAFCAAGSVIAFVTAYSLCRKKTAIFAVFVAALPLAACFVVTDRVPESRYLYFLLVGILVLLISNLTRRKDLRQGNFLTVLAVVPVTIALMILFLLIPRNTYQGQNRADKLLQTIQKWTESIGKETGFTGTGGLEQTVELDQLGRLLQTHMPVMTVQAEHSGTLYLRKQGFQMYDGISWYNEYGNDIYQWIQWEQMEKNGTVQIMTRNQHLMKFVPYYAKAQIHHPEGDFSSQMVAVNTLGITENVQQEYGYTFYLYQLSPNAPSAIAHSEGGLQFPVGSYSPDAISLPASTVAWAEPVVLPLIEGKYTVKERAEAIGDYVRGLAEYSRNTARMPAGETDFAHWFTTEAETGYCVHFATTAAVLLRAAGIQAQYVEGYTVRLQDGQAVTVYEDQAHAWVEYYDPAVGWRILESTPTEGVPGYIHVSSEETQTQPQQVQIPQQNPEQTLQQPESAEQPQNPRPVLWWILGSFGVAFLIWGQWQLRLWVKKNRLKKGNANMQALQLWGEITRLCRLLRQRPEQQLYALAQKAKFSQHVLRPEELAILTDALTEKKKSLKAKSWILQAVYTIFLAVY